MYMGEGLLLHLSKRFKKPFIALTVLFVVAVFVCIIANYFSMVIYVHILFCALLFLLASYAVCIIRHIKPVGKLLPLFIVGSLVAGIVTYFEPIARLYNAIPEQVFIFHAMPFNIFWALIGDGLDYLLAFSLLYLLLRFCSDSYVRLHPVYLAINPYYLIIGFLVFESIVILQGALLSLYNWYAPMSVTAGVLGYFISTFLSQVFVTYIKSSNFHGHFRFVHKPSP
jgi:hypothetical protein